MLRLAQLSAYTWLLQQFSSPTAAHLLCGELPCVVEMKSHDVGVLGCKTLKFFCMSEAIATKQLWL